MTTALPHQGLGSGETPGGAARLPVLEANPGLGQRSGQAVKGATILPFPYSPPSAPSVPSSLLQKATPGTSQPPPSHSDRLCRGLSGLPCPPAP